MSAAGQWLVTAEQRASWAAEHARLAVAGRVGGAEFKASLPSAALALPPAELAHLWGLADRDQDGALTLSEFVVARALVEGRVAGAALPESAPASLLDAPTPTPTPYAALTPPLIAQYRATFATVQAAGRVAAAQAQGVFAQSGLESAQLADVWRLADRDHDNVRSASSPCCSLLSVASAEELSL